MVKILHFADAHIDMANYGRRDPHSGLPLRVLDFLQSLDEIVAAAEQEQVDLVVFAGDAYKDRNPSPTYQREWDRRIMRLSRAGIPTLLLVGNHDISPAVGRAHALAEFNTLQVPGIRIVDQPSFLTPDDLSVLTPDQQPVNLQVIALPWISRPEMAELLELPTRDQAALYQAYLSYLDKHLTGWLEQANPDLPTLVTAHASVEGAVYGGERGVSLGSDPVLPLSLLTDPRIDYAALGHIHKPQDLNPDRHPPVVYPGSIERVDFGEAQDPKFYLLAEISRGKTELDWRELKNLRTYLDLHFQPESNDDLNQQIVDFLPSVQELEDAVVRLVLEYPRSWEALIDEQMIRDHAAGAFEFHLVKQPIIEKRFRLPKNQTVGSLTPRDLLEKYWEVSSTPVEERQDLNRLASEIFEAEEDQL